MRPTLCSRLSAPGLSVRDWDLPGCRCTGALRSRWFVPWTSSPQLCEGLGHPGKGTWSVRERCIHFLSIALFLLSSSLTLLLPTPLRILNFLKILPAGLMMPPLPINAPQLELRMFSWPKGSESLSASPGAPDVKLAAPRLSLCTWKPSPQGGYSFHVVWVLRSVPWSADLEPSTETRALKVRPLTPSTLL